MITTRQIKINERYEGRLRSLQFENSQGKFAAGVMQAGERDSTCRCGNG